MSENLYFKSTRFSSNKALANYFHEKFKAIGFAPETPIDEDYMFIIPTKIDGEAVNFYLGKNDEDSNPPLWQIWLAIEASFFRKILGKVKKTAERKARTKVEEIVKRIDGVSNVEWDK